MTSLRTSLVALTIVAAVSASASAAAPQTPAQTTPPAALSKEVAALQGHWVVTLLNDQDPQGALELQFEGNKYAVVGGGADETGTFKLDASKTPWTFDLSIADGN